MSTAKTWVVVADAGRAKIYRQARPGAALETALDHDFIGHHPKPSASEDARPGRVHERKGEARHAMEPTTDPKRVAQHAFAVDLAASLREAADAGQFEDLVLVAPPQMLGELRSSLDDRIRGKVIGELGKDLAKLKIHELPPHLSEILHFA